MNDTYQNIPIESVYESKTNPRRHFDEAKLAELMDSVKQVGILEPLLVRSNGKPEMFELIAGARRYRAGKKAGLKEVPVRICVMTDQQVLEVQLIENLLREDVDQIDEGLGFRALLNLRDESGKAVHNVDSIAARLSKNRAYVYARLKMAEGLEAPVQKAFHAGKITAGHAILLARLQPADQAEMFKFTVDHDYSVRQLESQIQRTVHLDLHAAAFPKDSKFLVPSAGSCVECPKRTGFQPDLFPDIAKKDTCTDPTCYKTKSLVFIQLRQKEIEAETKISPVLLSSLHYTSDKLAKGVHLAGEYAPTAGKKNCTAQKIGLLVDGEKQGQVITVCMDRKCKVHHDRYGYSSARQSSPADKEKRAKELAAQRLNAEIRRRTLTEVLAKVKWPLGRVELQGIAKAYLEEMHADALKAICQHFKLEPAKSGYTRSYTLPLGKYIEQAPDRELAAFLVLLTIGSSAAQYARDAIPAQLKSAAAHYKVDPAAIARTVAAEMAAKVKKPVVQTSAKPKAKAAGR